MRIKSRAVTAATAAFAALTLAACLGGGDSDNTGDAETDAGSADTQTTEAEGGGDAAPAGDGTVLRLAHNQTEEHPTHVALTDMGTALSDATEGRWSIEVFPNATLGDQGEYLQSVSSGVIDMAIVSAPQLENLNGDFVIFSLPTVFDSIDSQMSVLANQDVVGDIYTSLEGSNNITVIGGLTQDFRSIYTSDGPVETPADLAGLKIRVQESPVFISMMNALGASPTPMAYGEVYTGIQSGVIDGAENNIISYQSQKHYEVAPYFSYTNHLLGADFLIINTEVLNEMSDEDRAAFDEAWTGAWEQHTELWKADTETARAEAEADGATFAEVDAAAFQEALTPLLDEFLTTPEQQALLEAIKSAQ